MSEDQDGGSGAVQNSTVKITELKDTNDMSTQSEKPVQNCTVVNGDTSGVHIDMSEESTNASVDVASDTNSETPTSEGSEEAPSLDSNKNGSSGENVDDNDVQTEKQNDNSSNVNPEVVDFVNDVVTEVASQVEEKHGDAVHDSNSQTTDTHGATENGEYRPVVAIDVLHSKYLLLS